MWRFDWLKRRLLPLALMAFAALASTGALAQFANVPHTTTVSLPPFTNYGTVTNGNGNSYAKHKVRTKKEVAALFRAAARGQLTDFHVSCASLVDEYADLGLPRLEGCDLIANLIESDAVEEIPCTSEILRDHYVARTNLSGNGRDYTWSRPKDRCFKGETMLRYKPNGSIFTSTYCVNTLIPKVARVSMMSRPRRESPFECVLITGRKCP